MNDVGVIDRFTNVFSQYIDSAKLVKKTLYVGAFAFIINNFNTLANVLFRSFAGLGLTASGSTLTEAELLQPGRLASIGIDAGRPMLEIIGQLSGFPEVFANLDTVAVLFLAWLIVIVSFFVLSVQMFVALIEFKLTTLAGFVLVPFSLWNKTAFLAEKVLGNVVSSGIKILVLAVIVGIGGSVFGEFTQPIAGEFTSDEALAIMLASLAMLGLGIFGPGIAAGLVSGAPQLSAGAAAGSALAVGGLAAAGLAGGAAAGRLAGRATRAAGSLTSTGARGALQGAQALARGARGVAQTYQEGAEASGLSGIGSVAAGVERLAQAGEAGLKNAARSGLSAASAGAQGLASAARAKFSSGFRAGFSGSLTSSSGGPGSAGSLGGGSSTSTPAGSNTASESSASAPGWAQHLRDQGMSTGLKAAANVITSGDRPASGSSPTLTSNDEG